LLAPSVENLRKSAGWKAAASSAPYTHFDYRYEENPYRAFGVYMASRPDIRAYDYRPFEPGICHAQSIVPTYILYTANRNPGAKRRHIFIVVVYRK
jgi:hypothetical protein